MEHGAGAAAARTLRANDAFYRALEKLDLAAMDALWLHEAWVRCVHPGWDALVGWPGVRRSFEQIFAGTRWLHVTPTAIDVHGASGRSA